jgi:hypothetical protein
MPALTALGGWADAPWFCPSVLSDSEVVGFTLPAILGLRRQSFTVIDRAEMGAPKSGRMKTVLSKQPSRLAGKVAHIFEISGATRAVACCRAKFLFEAGAVLFFGEFPIAKLKQRAANKLRREFIEIGLVGCILRVESASAIGMFWPASETRITDFVNEAVPDHALHKDFAKAAILASGGGATPAPKQENDRQAKFLAEIRALRAEIESLKKGQSPLVAMEQLGLDDARLKSMLKLLHPDKHGNSDEATDAAKWVNNLRELLKKRTG